MENWQLPRTFFTPKFSILGSRHFPPLPYFLFPSPLLLYISFPFRFLIFSLSSTFHSFYSSLFLFSPSLLFLTLHAFFHNNSIYFLSPFSSPPSLPFLVLSPVFLSSLLCSILPFFLLAYPRLLIHIDFFPSFLQRDTFCMHGRPLGPAWIFDARISCPEILNPGRRLTGV